MYLMRRRNATIEFLKECMADALLKLLREKSIDEITVSEITDLADVGRVTFYRHFKTKEDLIYFKCRLIGDRWYNDLTDAQKSNTNLLTESFFELMVSMEDILLTLYRANLHYIVLKAIYDSMRWDKPSPQGDELYSYAFLAFGLFGILTEWIDSGCQKTPKELTILTLKNIRV